MFSEDAHYEFLKRYYRAEFFEGRNGSIWGINYSYNLARVGMNMLERYGYGIILKHESITGETIYYDRSLTINICDEYSGLKRYGARPVSATRPVSVSLSV